MPKVRGLVSSSWPYRPFLPSRRVTRTRTSLSERGAVPTRNLAVAVAAAAPAAPFSPVPAASVAAASVAAAPVAVAAATVGSVATWSTLDQKSTLANLGRP